MSNSTEVAHGIHLIHHAHVNCYLIEDADGLTLVDAGLPRVWNTLGQTIRDIGRDPRDLRAVLLTHAHFDHVGVARRLQDQFGLQVWVHPEEVYLAAHPYRYAHENPRASYPIRHPRAVPLLTSMALAGALRVRGVDGTRVTQFAVTGQLEVPGRPVPLATPGHTYGHCAFLFPERDAILTGDALVTLDPYTAQVGPRIVAGAATADSALALDSLGALEATGVTIVLPGHGAPWTTGVAAAVEHAREVGRA